MNGDKPPNKKLYQGRGSIKRKVGSLDQTLCAVALDDSQYCLCHRLSSLCVSICVSGHINEGRLRVGVAVEKKIRDPSSAPFRGSCWMCL
jgi:hypothetical protein